MDCDKIKELLSSYVDDELAPGERGLVEAHLADCAGCSLDLARLKEAVAAVKGMERLRLPEPAADRLEAAVRARLKVEGSDRSEGSAAGRYAQWWRRPAFGSVVAAAAVIVLAVTVWSGPGTTGRRRLESPAPRPPTGAPAEPDAATKLLKDRLGEVFSKDDVDQLTAETARTGGRSDLPTPADERLGYDSAAEGDGLKSSSLEAVAAAISRERPARPVVSYEGLFEDTDAWIVVVELVGEEPRFIGGVVAKTDGRVLYRTARVKPADPGP